jgi:hypothetical protein
MAAIRMKTFTDNLFDLIEDIRTCNFASTCYLIQQHSYIIFRSNVNITYPTLFKITVHRMLAVLDNVLDETTNAKTAQDREIINHFYIYLNNQIM